MLSASFELDNTKARLFVKQVSIYMNIDMNDGDQNAPSSIATGGIMAEERIAAEALNDERAMRRIKRQNLIDAGINPYPIHVDLDAHAEDILAKYADLANGEEVEDSYTIAGRIRAIRGQGKIKFIVLEDSTASIQLFCRINSMDPESWELLGKLDMGDIIAATGIVTRTRRGELSLIPSSIQLLSKSCRPLPEKFHGLTDKEIRYRQRYVDLIMNPEVRDTFRKRSAIIAAMRQYMADQGFMEVETPILQSIMGGANARPFITHFNALNQENYLRIATELHLKRLLVGGFERVYEIGRIFRNEGMDQTHNPEFTSMEAYQAYGDLQDMKRLSEGFIKAGCHAVCDSEHIIYQGQEIDLSGTWRSVPMSQLVSEVVGEELNLDTPVSRYRELCDRYEIAWDESWTQGKLLAELYDEIGEASIVNPTFVVDYPVEVSPLAKRKDEDPRLTDRFELVIAGHEYANAFSELNDPVDQEGRFAAQMEAKRQGDDEAMEYDTDYIRALEYGMPPAGGVGLGIDRIVMLLCDEPSIRDVLLFPHMKPEDGAARKVMGSSQAEIAPEEIGFSKVEIEPLFKDYVDFDTFSKSDFRVVKCKECTAVPKSKKLLKFVLDDGTGEDRVILSGIHNYYEPEELVGKTLIAITNLPPRAMMGIDSCGMLLSAVHEEEGEERLNLLMVDDRIPAGAKIY